MRPLDLDLAFSFAALSQEINTLRRLLAGVGESMVLTPRQIEDRLQVLLHSAYELRVELFHSAQVTDPSPASIPALSESSPNPREADVPPVRGHLAQLDVTSAVGPLARNTLSLPSTTLN